MYLAAAVVVDRVSVVTKPGESLGLGDAATYEVTTSHCCHTCMVEQ